jgi:hypothetical protein
MRRYWLGPAVLAGLLGVVGCGPGYNKVEGVVQYEDGSPVSGAMVAFIPTSGGGGSDASGITNESGNFTLRTGNVEGAKKGKYKVVITKAKGVSNPTGAAIDPTSPDAIKAMKKNMGKAAGPGVAMPGKGGKGSSNEDNEIDGQYASAESTPLSADVPSGPLTFKVKGRKGQK